MLINFRPQARSSTGICVAWPAALSPLIYFFFSDFVASAWGVGLGPASLGGDNKRCHHCRYPRPRHLPLPTPHENQRNLPRNGERSSWGRSESLLVGMSGGSVLADGWHRPPRPRGIQSHPASVTGLRIHHLTLGKRGRRLLSILGRLPARTL